MATSARLFAERGLAGTTMRAIADECGIQAASLYHHFGSKDDLIAAIMTRSSAHVVDLYDQICAADLEPVARFEALIRATLENFHRHTHEAQMFYDNPTYVAAAPASATTPKPTTDCGSQPSTTPSPPANSGPTSNQRVSRCYCAT